MITVTDLLHHPAVHAASSSASATPISNLTIRQAANRCGIGVSTLYALAQSNRIPVIRYGRAIRLSAETVERLAREGIPEIRPLKPTRAEMQR